eukprot:TRINITY_DN73634_c0_g1_i1.p1 TRINITY_DN73634_c0_g1~~TRINITY_DN73634_c0_g1_i1.p1  ORF type:complete len:116 (+),score=21.35 TRINITY_DN73634_c0_g1_i1:154-501(+)
MALKKSQLVAPSRAPLPTTWWKRLVTRCCGGQKPAPIARTQSRVSFDEENIAMHILARRIEDGTQPVDEQTTPFLLHDSKMSREEHTIIEKGTNHQRTTVDISKLETATRNAAVN